MGMRKCAGTSELFFSFYYDFAELSHKTMLMLANGERKLPFG